MSEPPRHRNTILCAALVAILSLAAFFPAICNDFVNYDDNVYITENIHVSQGLSWDGVLAALLVPQNAGWNPIATLSHMLDVELFGMNPGPHHAVNVVLHTINSVLLFWILRKTTGEETKSVLVAALFAVHPLHVEPVAWVSSRKDVLSTFFMLLTINSYIQWTRRPRSGAFAGTLALYAMALLSKPMTVTLPLLLLLMDYWPLSRMGAQTPVLAEKKRAVLRCVYEKLPFLALSLATSVLTYLAQRSGGAVRDWQAFPLTQRVANAAISYCAYVKQIILPFGFSPHYPHPGDAVSTPLAAACTAALVTITVFTLVSARRAPWLIVGWFWYVTALVPVIGVIQIGSFARADRFAYVPSIGILLVLVWAVAGVLRSTAARIAVFAPALAACMVLSWHYVGVWRDSYSLWSHALSVTPNNAVAHNNLGVELLRQGAAVRDAGEYEMSGLPRLEEAEHHLREALRLEPAYVHAHNNLGLVLDALGEPNARQSFETALRFDPDNVDALVNLANALQKEGKTDDAIQLYLRAQSIDGMDFDAYYNLGIAYLNTQRPVDAIRQFIAACSLRASNADARIQLARAYIAANDAVRATAAGREAVQIEPENFDANYQYGVALMLTGQFVEAESALAKAVALRPDDPMALYNYGVSLGNQGRIDAAKKAFEAALARDPNHELAKQALSAIAQNR